MCIKLIRWFHCEMKGEAPQVPPAPVVTDPLEHPWGRWRHAQPLDPAEPARAGLRELTGYHYVRHKTVNWIRCAMNDVTTCRQYPLEIRVEVYHVACPLCTGDDPCILPVEPFQVYRLDCPLMTGQILDGIVKAYAEEVMTIASSFFTTEMHNLPLEKESWDVHQRGLYCTVTKEHNLTDHPSLQRGPRRAVCNFAEGCPCTTQPWAHNGSRAARNQDATQLRIKRAPEWFYFAFTEQDAPGWAQNCFADMPRQQWLNMHPDGGQRLSRLKSQIINQAIQLIGLGPTIEIPPARQPAYTDTQSSRFIRERQLLVNLLIAYPALDPGINNEFLDRLMSDHFLTALCPDLNTTKLQGPYAKTLICRQPASAEMRRLSSRANVIHKIPAMYERFNRAIQQRDALLNELERNRTIAYHNAIVKGQVAAGKCLNMEMSSNLAASRNPNGCQLCQRKFDADNRPHDIPLHLRAMITPCCRNHTHISCFRVVWDQGMECPYCNTDITRFMSTFYIDPNLGLGWTEGETRVEDLPPGMVIPSEPRSLGGPQDELVDQIQASIAAEQRRRAWALSDEDEDQEMDD